MSYQSRQLRPPFARQPSSSFAVRGLVSLVLFSVPASALELLGSSADPRFLMLTGLMALHLLWLWLLPVRRLSIWIQLAHLLVQCGFTVAAQAQANLPLLDFVYLAIVVQAITLFRPWLWIPFAVFIWVLWSGGVLVASSLFAWLQSNLAFAFPATCVIIAAIVYARQQRRNEQVEALLQQARQRSEELALALREMQQHFMLEERQRLAETVAGEIQGALVRAEQSAAGALGQAQLNLARLQVTVAQTRDAASQAVERLRAAVAALRRGESLAGDAHDFGWMGLGEVTQAVHSGPVHALLPTLDGLVSVRSNPPGAEGTARDEGLISSLFASVLTWVLPTVFFVVAIPMVALQQQLALAQLGPLLYFAFSLLLVYICTQRVHHSALVMLCLSAQAVAVIGMAVIAQSLPLLLGLVLVLWQLVMRLSLGQVALILSGAPLPLGLTLAHLMPAQVNITSLFAVAIASVIVAGPLLLARRQLRRRHEAELKLVALSTEMERQTEVVRGLAVAAERARLAREYHDDLGSRLMLINLQLQLADDLLADDPLAALAQLATTRDQIRDAWQSALNAADAMLPLNGPALRREIRRLVEQSQIDQAAISLDLDHELDQLPPAAACTVYRAVQEGLTNARKHARASHIAVRAVSDGQLVTVSISDDGSGRMPHPTTPLPSTVGAQGSFGLIGLRERAAVLGGGVEAGPLPGGGWRLTVILPIEG